MYNNYNDSKLTHSIQRDYLRDAENYRVSRASSELRDPVGSFLRKSFLFVLVISGVITFFQTLI